MKTKSPLVCRPIMAPPTNKGASSASALRRRPDRVRELLESIYAQVPPVNCKGLCQECCGPIAFFPVEADAMRRHGFPLPMYDAAAPLPMTQSPNTKPGETYCSNLAGDGRCTIYPARPLVCRLWGAIPAMSCHHGCLPEGVITTEDVHQLMRSLQELSLIMCGTGEQMFSDGHGPNMAEILRSARTVAASEGKVLSEEQVGEITRLAENLLRSRRGDGDSVSDRRLSLRDLMVGLGGSQDNAHRALLCVAEDQA